MFYNLLSGSLFNQMLSQLLREEGSSHVAINMRRLLVKISTTIYSQILIHTSNWCMNEYLAIDSSNVDWKKLAQSFTLRHRIQTWVLFVERSKFYAWATVLYNSYYVYILCKRCFCVPRQQWWVCLRTWQRDFYSYQEMHWRITTRFC